MADQNSNDERIDGLKDRLAAQLVDEKGHPAPAGVVQRVVEEKAKALKDQPIQDFVPLLIEHQGRDQLRQHGLHRDLGDHPGEDEAAVSGDAAVTDDDRRCERAHRRPHRARAVNRHSDPRSSAAVPPPKATVRSV